MVYPQFVPVNSISKRTDLPEKRTKWLHSSAEEDCRIRCRLLKACRLELESELEWLPPDLGGACTNINHSTAKSWQNSKHQTAMGETGRE